MTKIERFNSECKELWINNIINYATDYVMCHYKYYKNKHNNTLRVLVNDAFSTFPLSEVEKKHIINEVDNMLLNNYSLIVAQNGEKPLRIVRMEEKKIDESNCNRRKNSKRS